MSQFENVLLHSLHMYILLESLKFTHVKASAGSANSSTWQLTRGFFCRSARSEELPEGPDMASVGPEGIDATCNISSSSWGDAGIMGVEEQWALSGDCPVVEGAFYLPELGDRVLEEGGADFSAPQTLVVPRSTS